jgi:tetratricopeptide (TPR) repeat protein
MSQRQKDGHLSRARCRLLVLGSILVTASLFLRPLAVEAATGTDDKPICVAGQSAKEAIEGCTKTHSLPDIDALERTYAYLLRGAAYVSIHDWAPASSDYEEAQKLRYNRDIGLALAYIDVNVGKYSEAISELTKIVDAGTATAQVFNIRGAAFQNAGDYDASIEDFNKVLVLNPKDLMALNNRASAYEKKGDYRSAGKDIDTVLAANPDMPTALANRCEISAREGKMDEGRAYCDKAERLDGKSYFTLFAIGGAYYLAQRYAEAISYYSRSLDLLPDEPRILYARGIAYSKLGKDDESKKDLSEAERIQPDVATVMAKVGIK